MAPAVALGCVAWLVMSAQRRYLLSALLVTALGGALLSGCSSSPPVPQPTASAFLAAWGKQDWAAMRQLTSDPSADFTPVNQAAFGRLSVRQASFTAGTMTTSGSAASEPVTERLTLAGLGAITLRSSLHLVLLNGKWLVKWSPATIVPQLRTGGSQLGAPYTARNSVGQTGLEQAAERQLAGTPGATVSVVSASGAHVATLATLPPRPGQPVTTTIEPSVQRAAEAALAGEKKSAALVAVSASTGAVLAAVSVNSGGFDQAIDGGFPPGSTFKVITSTALIGHGLTPRSSASCPGTATVDGEVFHNAESEAPVSNLLQAFTESCNTAFIRLATGHLSPSDFPSTAAMFGLGDRLHIGLVAFGGSVPKPKDEADLAATSIGQGRVLMSPLAMAMIAAAADTGTVRAPQLVTSSPGGSSAGGAVAGQLPASVVSDLHEMMASVVARGTAAGQGLPAGTYAKTGTAQYGTTKPLKTDAWLMGFKGDIAFAALVVDSAGNGGPTCGPIVAKFLKGL